MNKKENPLDWESSANRLAAFMEPFYQGREQLLKGLQDVTQDAKHIDVTKRLESGRYIRILKSTGSYLRLLLTTDCKTYPGEYYAAPESLIEGYKINYEKSENNELKIKDIVEIDLNQTKKIHYTEYRYKPNKHFDSGNIDPIEATLVWLPKLKIFFAK